MQQTLNFNSKQILSKEELKLWDESLRELLGNILRYTRVGSQVSGILDTYNEQTSQFTNDFFKVELGSIPQGGYNTLKINQGKGVLLLEGVTSEFISGLTKNNDSLSKQLVSLFKWNTLDNIVVPGIGGYSPGNILYVGFNPIWNPLEDGSCTLTTSNQVTISGGDFYKLRGQSTKNPTKIRFFKSDGSPANNTGVFEVVSIVSPTQIIVSGTPSSESGVKYMIIGSYDLKEQGNLSSKYSYVTANGRLTFSQNSGDITGSNGFLVASLLFSTPGVFSIVDLRLANIFNFAYSSDIVYKSLVQTITGKKTFSGTGPDFNAPVKDLPNPSSFLSSITLAPLGNPSYGVANIPVDGGNVFKIKADAGVPGSDTLKSIQFPSDHDIGTVISLIVDSTGDDLLVECKNISNGIVAYTGDGVLFNGYIAKGSIIELWSDDNLTWKIKNFNIIKDKTDWVQLFVIYDGTAKLLSPATNVIKYKRDGDIVVLQIERLTAVDYPVSFNIPFEFEFEVHEICKYDWSLSSVLAHMTVSTSGDVYINSGTVLGYIHKQLFLHI